MSDELEDPVLYVRGLNNPADDIEDVWDDSILNNAYDKALSIANEEVAKRVAMETNSKKKEKASSVKPKAKGKYVKNEKSPKAATSKKEPQWKAGMPCRAVYEEDGLEYEAFLIKILDEEECIVKFLGYDNTERVPISCLTETLGNDERMRQVEAAIGERDDDGFESEPSEPCSEVLSPEPERSSSKKKKTSKGKKKHRSPERDFGELPHLPMPHMNMFRHMSADMPMPMPPPPLASLSDRTDAEEQAISDMLLSWYMTGYYTGLYQGLKRQRQSRSSYI